MREVLEATRSRNEDRQQDNEQAKQAVEVLERRLAESEVARLLAEEQAADLKSRLKKAGEENRSLSDELQKIREGLRRTSDPEQRLRAGISLFNASEHTRTVASISKALGLPKVHIDSSGDSGSSVKPLITFVWSDIAWRRYVSDPTEGVKEPRVYLVGAGDEPSDINREPNARIDPRGRLMLGIQAR
jgi:predicted RNase H-like nuclease (RuvC/YqgF family)